MKFYGNVGFAFQEETAPDVYQDTVTKRPYRGDVVRRRRKWNGGENLTDEFDLDNEISIVADDYIRKHLSIIRFVEWMDCAWEVKSAEVQFPRIILTIGGVYNGDTSSVS